MEEGMEGGREREGGSEGGREMEGRIGRKGTHAHNMLRQFLSVAQLQIVIVIVIFILQQREIYTNIISK